MISEAGVFVASETAAGECESDMQPDPRAGAPQSPAPSLAVVTAAQDVAAALKSAVEAEHWTEITIHHASTMAEAVTLVENGAADVLLLDGRLIAAEGPELAAALAAAQVPPLLALLAGTAGAEPPDEDLMDRWEAVEWLDRRCDDRAALKRLIRHGRLRRKTAAAREVADTESEAAIERATALAEAKSRFLAAVSHELRSPINAILGFSEIIQEQLIGREALDSYSEYAGLINKSGKHLLALINELLDHAKLEAGQFPIHPEPVEMHAACREVLREVASLAADKNITLDNNFASTHAMIYADKRRLRQMIWNLCSNAIKFTPEGGRVTFSTSRTDDGYTLRVCDTGIGISADDLDRIGQPFFQVENSELASTPGTGLGLSLVKRLMALHDGQMTVDSASGKGTCVSLSFPPLARRNRATTDPRPA